MKKSNSAKNQLNRKPKLFLLLTAVILLSALTWVIFSAGAVSKTGIVAYINGEPVTIREFSQAMLRNRADIYAYFKQVYGVDDSPEFWTQSHQGETPLEKLKNTALDAIVKIKVQQILAREKGIVQDISYEKFLSDLKAENARRKEAVKNHQVIYGPVEYSEEVFFDIVFSNMVGNLKEKLNDEWGSDEGELKKYYDSNIPLFKESDTIITQRISVSYRENEKTAKTEAEKAIQEVKQRMDQGESLANVSAHLSSSIVIEIEEHIFYAQSARSDAMQWPELAEAAKVLAEGQTSNIVDFDGAYHLLHCVGRTEGKVVPFSEVKSSIARFFLENAYEDLLDKLAEDAKTVVNEKVYGKINESCMQ